MGSHRQAGLWELAGKEIPTVIKQIGVVDRNVKSCWVIRLTNKDKVEPSSTI